MKSGLKNTLISILLSALLFSCDDDGENSNFTPYSISGTLSPEGAATGQFSITINDKYGNAQGTAQVLDDSFTLVGSAGGSSAAGQINLQFQNGKKYSDGWIYSVEDPNGMSGTFWLADATGKQIKGTVSGTKSTSGGKSGGSGTGCSSLVGKWVSADGFHSWEFTETTAIIRTKSSDTAGALQISYLNYTNNGSSITYFITRAAVTGSGGSDYDNPVNPPKGPYTENYSLSDCKMSIGGKNYTKN
ncbi:MAG: hypothetical protein RL189_2185 [Pseudomonadota bacterium]|jgi:hypothetical protein